MRERNTKHRGYEPSEKACLHRNATEKRVKVRLSNWSVKLVCRHPEVNLVGKDKTCSMSAPGCLEPSLLQWGSSSFSVCFIYYLTADVPS